MIEDYKYANIMDIENQWKIVGKTVDSLALCLEVAEKRNLELSSICKPDMN